MDRAARSLRDIYGDEILDAWDSSYKLHQKGINEVMPPVNDILYIPENRDASENRGG